jgi:hypothetical protein
MKTPVSQFNYSLSWIFQSFDIYNKSPETTIRDAFSNYVKDGKCILINHGLLIAACYLYFLYPKEKGMENIYIDSNKFNSNYAKNDFVRRIRNALAHGGIKIESDGSICFTDNNKKKSDPFEAKISPIALSDLIEEIGKKYIESC